MWYSFRRYVEVCEQYNASDFRDGSAERVVNNYRILNQATVIFGSFGEISINAGWASCQSSDCKFKVILASQRDQGWITLCITRSYVFPIRKTIELIHQLWVYIIWLSWFKPFVITIINIGQRCLNQLTYPLHMFQNYYRSRPKLASKWIKQQLYANRSRPFGFGIVNSIKLTERVQ